MGRDMLKKSERMVWREGNSNAKRLLRGLGISKTDKRFLRDWLSSRVHCSCNVESDEYPIKVCYDLYVGAFKTWADACYQIALMEKRKGKKI